jgi:hypothetical protein
MLKKGSYNKTTKLVNQMMLKKLEEIHYVIKDLQVLTQSNKEITIAQRATIEQYITCCTNFISATHEFHIQSSRFQLV